MAALRGAPELTLSHFPPNRSEPLLGRSIGDALREAAAVWPRRIALIEGIADRTRRRRWTFASLRSEAEQIAVPSRPALRRGNMSRNLGCQLMPQLGTDRIWRQLAGVHPMVIRMLDEPAA